MPPDAAVQDVFRHLATDKQRAEFISTTIAQAYQEGRKVLVLTERTDHLDLISQNLAGVVDFLFILHGRMLKKRRTQIIQKLNELPPDAPRVLLATGKLVGEGFDHPPLDTLVLAMPISWKGTLQQYAGRLHREHETKTDVRIYDYVDTGHPVLMRMWDKRQRGYKAMGYAIGE
ncbi:MAG: DEAD/DEAH box helicase [Candidatus Gallionella acididurans]|uniref:DEAD/DEAH box helicase n=1 Tax=Candidatus Gallionella acididurans TaxID=1796491 RepID=A0A139BPQ7_9PROT|nr:MAG: DEAD/DEAH box helicase [Candidatus Gallionella acididurans]